MIFVENLGLDLVLRVNEAKSLFFQSDTQIFSITWSVACILNLCQYLSSQSRSRSGNSAGCN